ncbi:hypothetical protein F4810DRAFT_677465 [Camillea tinctor]|nr:hypothetical protein F4810DRAFT_677465 [Camillea tinctor]
MTIMAATLSVSTEYLAESTSPTVHAVMWLSAGLALIFVSLRTYVRLYLKRVFGYDDALAIVAMLILVAYSAVTSVAASKGLGAHFELVAQNPQNLIDVALLCDIGEVLAIMACTLGKTSFAVTLLRIVVQEWIIRLLWFIIATMNLVNTLAAIFVFAQCEDPRHLWNPSIPSDCWPVYVFTQFSLFVGSYSGAQDFVFVILAWIVVWRLEMRKQERLGILLSMSLGLFAGAASVVKTTYLVALSQKSDFTWELAPLLWWAAVEDALTIIAASIPTLRPILQKIVPSFSSRPTDYQLKDITKSTVLGSRFRKIESSTTLKVGYSKQNSNEDGSVKSILERQGEGQSRG